MEIMRILKRNVGFLLCGTIIIIVLSYFYPSFILVPSIITEVLIFYRIYTNGGRNFFELDISLLIATILLSGSPSFILLMGCGLFPESSACHPNELRAILFLMVFFPLVIGLILWLTIRLPMIIKSFLSKLS